MSVPFRFTVEDTHELCAHLLERDADAVTEWMRVHIVTHRDMHALLNFLCRAIMKIWPMSLTKAVTLEPGQFWGLKIGTATPAQVAGGQMMTAAFNEQWDTLTALINTTISMPDIHHAEVSVVLLSALQQGMEAVVADQERGAS